MTLVVVNPDGTTEPAIRKLSKEEHDLYAGAVVRATNILPAWRDSIALIRPFFDATCDTAYTDRYSRVGLSRWFFEDLDVVQRTSVLLHEASHVLYNCFVRGEALGAEPGLNNMASDLEINSALDMVPTVDLSFGLLPHKDPFNWAKNMTQEQYYHLLKENGFDAPKPPQKPDPNCPQHGQQDQQGSPTQDGEDKKADKDNNADGSAEDSGGNNGSHEKGETEDADSGDGNGNGNSEGGDSGGQGQPGSQGGHQHGDSGPECTCPQQGNGSGDGSGQGQSQGQGKGCDEATEDRINGADDIGVERASDAEQSIAKKNTAVRIEEEAKKSRAAGHGHMADFLELALKRMQPARVNWRTVFRRVISVANEAVIRGRNDYSYRRVSRRLSDSPFIFPGMVKYQPKTMFGIDTSGSMSHDDYMRAITEVEGILKTIGRGKGALRVFSIDTQVGNVKPVDSIQKINLQGGGGTDMAVGFKYVNSLNKVEKPDIFVLATDGYTSWPAVESAILEAKGKKYVSVVLVTTDGGYNTVTPSLKKLTTVINISSGED